MQAEQNPLILTLKLDESGQAFFDRLRERYFPSARNYLKAHLTLFHQLPNQVSTLDYLSGLQVQQFELMINGLRHLGAGVAYNLESPKLLALHTALARHFNEVLIPQDRQPFQPHITIQNKVTPETSKILLAELRSIFEPFAIQAVGLDVWEYLGGPWRHHFSYDFIST